MTKRTDEWDESLHPRGEDGKFGPGGGGTGEKGDPKGLPSAGFKGKSETPTEFHERQATKFKKAAEHPGDEARGLSAPTPAEREQYRAKAAAHEAAADRARRGVAPHEADINTKSKREQAKELAQQAGAAHEAGDVKKMKELASKAADLLDAADAEEAAHQEAAKAAKLAVKAHENGGFTYSPTTGNFPTEGYAVAIHPEHEVTFAGKASLNAKQVGDYLTPRMDFFKQHPAAHLGGWYNPDDDKWYLDVSHITNDKQEAVSLGARYNQKGIYDLKEGRTITANEYGEIAAGDRGDSASDLRPADANARGDRGGDEGDPGRGSQGQRPAGRLVNLADKLDELKAKRADLDTKLAALKLASETIRKDWDENQPRDEGGRWTDGGGGGGAGGGDAVDRKLTGTGSSSREPAKSKEPSEGLKKIANEVGHKYEDTDKKLVVRRRATRLEPKEHAYLEARANGNGAHNEKIEKSIASKLGVYPEHVDEVAKDYHEHGVGKEVAELRKGWQGKASGHLDTMAAFKQEGKWNPEREKIHQDYIESTLKGVPTSKEPTFYMTGGGPASGKTSGLLENKKAAIPDKTKAAHINADEAKEFLPEYIAGKKASDAYAASFVHEESSDTAKEGVEQALKGGHDVVFDSTGDSGIDKLSKKIESYRKMGAKNIVANYAVIDVDEAIKRSDKRAERTGRFVPHAYLRSNHADVARTLKGAVDRKLFDKLDVWDTTGKSPVHVASFTKSGGLVVHDKDLWDKAMARGNDEGGE